MELGCKNFTLVELFFPAVSLADSQNSMGRKGAIFLPLYQFYPLTNIQTFICSFTSEMTTF